MLSVTGPSADGQICLDCSRMRDWAIVVAATSIPSERYAAEEFQRWFDKATGLGLPIVTSAGVDLHKIHIGPASLPDGDPNADVTEVGEEGFRIVVERERLIMAGGEPRGTLYGVYQFFEDFLGVRFLTHDHTYTPKMAAHKIPCGTYTYVPPFSFRWSFYRENAEYPEFAARLRVNTVTEGEHLGGKTPQNLINHSFHWLVPFDKYGKDHPEYYALVDGKRDTNTGGGGPQLCVTNPEVIEIASESAIRYLNKNPGQRNVSVSQADTDAYCRCDVCEAVNQREGSPMGSQLAFVNAVAERTEKVHTDVKVGTLAYWYTRKPPANIRPRHNVQIQLCSNQCCNLHPIDDPNCAQN